MADYIYFTMLKNALLLLVLLSSIPVISGLLTGLIISVFQSVTQIQESTLSFVPKFIAISLALLITGPMIAKELSSFLSLILKAIVNV
ncbi:MAG: flagellar biosynthetic protein FliQ [Myxococcota bacterium]